MLGSGTVSLSLEDQRAQALLSLLLLQGGPFVRHEGEKSACILESPLPEECNLWAHGGWGQLRGGGRAGRDARHLEKDE